MHGIVSLLDGEHRGRVEALWSELEAALGLRGIQATPYPHFSYQVAEHYDLERLVPILGRLAQQRPAFKASTAGLGVFTGPQPVLFISLVRSPELGRFQASLWQAVAGATAGAVDYYAPANWVPHITLALGDLDHQNLPDAIRLLADRDLAWEIMVENIAVVCDAGNDEHEVRVRFELGAEVEG
jgi:2'-5' RNA ligase